MEIKVLGTGCAGCRALYETTKQAISELGCDVVLIKEEDLLKIMEYNVLSLPALVVDGKVVSAGNRISLSESGTFCRRNSSGKRAERTDGSYAAMPARSACDPDPNAKTTIRSAFCSGNEISRNCR